MISPGTAPTCPRNGSSTESGAHGHLARMRHRLDSGRTCPFPSRRISRLRRFVASGGNRGLPIVIIAAFLSPTHLPMWTGDHDRRFSTAVRHPISSVGCCDRRGRSPSGGVRRHRLVAAPTPGASMRGFFAVSQPPLPSPRDLDSRSRRGVAVPSHAVVLGWASRFESTSPVSSCAAVGTVRDCATSPRRRVSHRPSNGLRRHVLSPKPSVAATVRLRPPTEERGVAHAPGYVLWPPPQCPPPPPTQPRPTPGAPPATLGGRRPPSTRDVATVRSGLEPEGSGAEASLSAGPRARVPN